MRKLMTAVALVAAMGLAAQSAAAQNAGSQGFAPGYMDIGPTVGFGSVGGANVAFGARFETFLQSLPSIGNGMLGLQVGATYYSYSNAYYKVSYIPIGVTANYHFRLAETRLDPFVGLGLGYQVVTCSVVGGGSLGCVSGGIYFIGRAGVRYFFSPKLALYADAGAGGAAVNVGVMFKLK